MSCEKHKKECQECVQEQIDKLQKEIDELRKKAAPPILQTFPCNCCSGVWWGTMPCPCTCHGYRIIPNVTWTTTFLNTDVGSMNYEKL